ncbi:MAG: hypothetical protein JST00_23300 [Deltaproteobacteria bacterium]|nr:hypothetical protein [Deltaproteobacteria bacterium]
MKKSLHVAWLASTLMCAMGCLPSGGGGDEQGGANANDRSTGGDSGELLEDGAMMVAPSGDYVLAQRRTSTVIVDVKARSYRELSVKADRIVFAPMRAVAYAVLANRAGVAAIDLATGKELWKSTPAFTTTASAFQAKVTSDDARLLVTDLDRVFFLDAKSGDVRDVAKIGRGPVELELLPGNKHAVAVSETTWDDAGAHTQVSLVDIAKQTAQTIDVPNCGAPISVLPDASRILLSPTFCTRDAKTAPPGWKNPDPVSVIDVDAANGTLRFVKNLPGFGPTALLADGRAVAYLDTKRIDPAMFEDKTQIPGAGAKQFHLMLIDPRSTKFELVPIGDKLPRFAASKDEKSLLVDATRSVLRAEGSVTVTLGGDGLKAEVKGSFGDDSGALFGVFDLASKTYTPFTGPAASLDRFVQTPDGSKVYTLRSNFLGGDLFGIDVAARATFDLGRSLRDIALLPDGTLVLRIRLERDAEGYLHEEYCFSTDAKTCNASVRYKSPVPQRD